MMIKKTLIAKTAAKGEKSLQIRPSEKLPQTQQTKPDWITAEQWKAVPSVTWWEDQKAGAEYIAQQKKPTSEEISAQFERLRNEKNWNEGK